MPPVHLFAIAPEFSEFNGVLDDGYSLVYEVMQKCMSAGMAYESPLYDEEGKPIPDPAVQ